MAIDLHWFNASDKERIIGGMSVRLWNLFNRRCVDATYWGVGLLQVGLRHLVYIGHEHGDLLFMRLWTVLGSEAHGIAWKLGLFKWGDRHALYIVRHRGVWGVLALLPRREA